MQPGPQAARPEPRPGRSETGLFLRQLLRNPGQVSALAPSSLRLAREIAARLPKGAETVAEFGGGTGRFTRALLDRGIAPANLIVFEINPAFVARLRTMFPGVVVHHGPAEDLARVGPERLDAVVSGLPLLSMPDPVRKAIVTAAFDKLRPGGVFLQFTYGAVSPAPEAVLARLGLGFRRSRRIWGNLPPARIYTYFRRSEAALVAAGR